MNITKGRLKKNDACIEGVKWFLAQKEKNGVKVIKKLVTEKKLDWANWGIVRIMTYKQRIQYAVFAAEQVIDIYEKKYPKDDRPRKAIEAAKVCIKSPTEKNKDTANAAAHSAYAAYAAHAAHAAYSAAHAAAYSDYSAAYSAAYAAYAAAYAAANAAMLNKILFYGLKILRKSK